MDRRSFLKNSTVGVGATAAAATLAAPAYARTIPAAKASRPCAGK